MNLDKRGRVIHPRSQLARRRNMFLGRFRQAEGTVRQLAADVAREYREAMSTLEHGQELRRQVGWKLQAIERMSVGVLTDLASLRKDCENFYQEVHNIKTPQPTTQKKEPTE
jgi:sugar-specific transcriptional regulator TrmB